MSLGTLGKYTLLDRLGEGGMGEVYRAASEGHSGFRRELAIKQMRQLLTGDARLTELFLAEARSLAELRHRNIVQVFEFDVANGRPYLVMELLHGVNLAPFIAAVRLPVEGVCFVGAELADALAAVHKTGRAGGQGGMVHGDLSPSNVMACVDGAVKLLDFGLATHEQADAATGPQAGKLPYLAPELLAGARCDALTDVYAVGVTLYELLMGARLFARGLEPRELSARIARADYPPLRAELPERVRAVVGRCLSRERAVRPNASQLAKILHGCHPRFGATELARFVRQAQGGPSALEPTGTVTRDALAAAVPADGPLTASALPLATPERPELPSTAKLMEGRLGPRGWQAGLAMAAVLAVAVIGFSLRSSRVASPPAAPPPVVRVEPPASAPVEAAPVEAPPPVVEPAPAPPKGGKRKRVAAKALKLPPDRLAPGFIAEPKN